MGEKRTDFEKIPDETEAVATQVVDAALKVHRALGPGLLESVYRKCLAHELRKRGYFVLEDHKFPVLYDGILIEAGLRFDLLVADCVIVETKSVADMHPIFEAQTLTYLRLTNKRLGFLINFNVLLLKHGIQRIVN